MEEGRGEERDTPASMFSLLWQLQETHFPVLMETVRGQEQAEVPERERKAALTFVVSQRRRVLVVAEELEEVRAIPGIPATRGHVLLLPRTTVSAWFLVPLIQ